MFLDSARHIVDLGKQSLWLTLVQLAPFILGFVMHRLIGPLDTYSAFGLLDKIAFAAILGGTGLMQALFFFAGDGIGRKDIDAYQSSMANGLFVSVLISFLLSLTIFFTGEILIAIGVDESIYSMVKELSPYVAVLIIPSILLSPLKIHLILQNKSHLLSVLFSFGSIVGIIACMYLVETLNVSDYDMTKSILLCVASVNAIVLIVSYFLGLNTSFPLPNLKGFLNRISRSKVVGLFALGWPISGVILIENFAILLSLLIIGRYWPEVLSIHTVVLLWISIGLLASLGISQAIVQKVSVLWSEGQKIESRKYCIAATILTFMFSGLLVLLFSVFPNELVGVFYRPDPTNKQIIGHMGQSMIQAGVLCGLQSFIVVFASMLRGIGQTRAPLFQALIGYGIFGGLSQYLFAFYLDQGVLGLWFGMNLGFAITALVIFRKVIKEMDLFRLTGHLKEKTNV